MANATDCDDSIETEWCKESSSIGSLEDEKEEKDNVIVTNVTTDTGGEDHTVPDIISCTISQSGICNMGSETDVCTVTENEELEAVDNYEGTTTSNYANTSSVTDCLSTDEIKIGQQLLHAKKRLRKENERLLPLRKRIKETSSQFIGYLKARGYQHAKMNQNERLELIMRESYVRPKGMSITDIIEVELRELLQLTGNTTESARQWSVRLFTRMRGQRVVKETIVPKITKPQTEKKT
jgi:hypothetical protein